MSFGAGKWLPHWSKLITYHYFDMLSIELPKLVFWDATDITHLETWHVRACIVFCCVIVLFQKKFFQAPPGRSFYYWCSLLCISIYCWYTIYIFTQQIINCHSFYRRTLGILALWPSRDNAEMGEISNGWLAKPTPVAIKCFLLCLFFAL